ncbi:MAG TPA: AAA family ATPase [Baekduia sp.]|nr:AAA family ATPase [Baekduia sp.]
MLGGQEAFVRAVRLNRDRVPEGAAGHYPWALPAVGALDAPLTLHPQVTFLVGANGSGKSTLLEAMAGAAGLNPEGGSSNFAFATRESHSPLADALTLVRGARRPRTDFFLRAESVFTAATYLESLPKDTGDPLAPYGGRSLHEQSHGESFLAIALHRLGPQGLYFLDEPEAALSFDGQLALLLRMHELAQQGAQWVVATHSPVLVAHPSARILLCDDDGLTEIAYDDVPAVRELRRFLADPQRQVSLLLEDEP